MLEAFLVAACVAAAILFWVRSAPRAARAPGALSIAAASGLALALWPEPAAPPAGLPRERPVLGYVSSQACKSCHPSEHASWHRSFHRTMTAVASEESVRAPFRGTRLSVDGRTLELDQRGGAFFATLPDPDLVAAQAAQGVADAARSAPLVTRQVVLTTGSHHYQAYWVGGARGNELRLLPVVYLLDERRFVPRKDAFLQPPDAVQRPVRWNSNCVMCHSVAGRPAHDEASDRFATEAVELGVACEACHGPGREHVERHKNPLSRYRAHFGEGRDDSIVNPARLPADRASEICGQCHSYFVPLDAASFWQSGFSERYRPGDVLAGSRFVLEYERDRARSSALVDADLESIFWRDGTIRIGGREHNALAQSACHTRGQGSLKLGCLSCHSMHDSEPDDQLAAAAQGDGACAGCHDEQAREGSDHTHHAPDSPGSRCYACHMPYTSYALFKGIRSHRVDSPSVHDQLSTGRPNACNLCHADRSLAWASQALARWYGAAPAVAPGEAPAGLAPGPNDTSAVLAGLYAGDAAERALSAFTLGLAETQRASGSDFQAPHLAARLDDPYSAVRLVALRALRKLPGFEDFSYDFLAPPEERRAAVARVLELDAERSARRGAIPRRPELLFREDGTLDPARIAELEQARDDRPITIAE